MSASLPHACGAVAVVAMAVAMAGWTGPEQAHGLIPLVGVLLDAAWPALLWLAGAAGMGRLAGRWTLDDPPLEVQLGLGVAVMLVADAAAGRVGLLAAAGGVPAWALSLGGAAALAVPPRRAPAAPHPLVWLAAPAAAALLVAACSAPGWLWRTEFGGYDALSYHLLLPREWMATGRIAGLEHNVYSFLPGYVEAAYLHLALLRRDAFTAAYSAQLLHALLAVATALAVGRAARRLGTSRPAAALGAAFFLATPWVVVVGSLAYNELAVTLLLATAVSIVAAPREPRSIPRVGAAVGLLAAAACGAKLTALGFVAVPIGLVLLACAPPRRWPVIAGAGLAAAALALVPWLAGNAAQTGNPVFPFAGKLLGLGHWTAEQAAIWRTGHSSDATLPARLAALWNQLGRFGVGPNPLAGEPWLPQWALLPWFGAIGAVLAAARPAMRRGAAIVLAIALLQIGFWLLATHLQSRFLLPLAVPAAIGAALGADALIPRLGRRWTLGAAGGLVVVQALITVGVFRGEGGGAPAARLDAARLLTGDAVPDASMAEAAAISPVIHVNVALPATARVLLVGDAAPYYFRLERVAYQTTWDRGPMSAVLAGHPPSSWPAALRSRGFTHVLVQPGMLEIWQRSGWADPRLTPSAVLDGLRAHAIVAQRFPDGSVLFRLGDARTASVGEPRGQG